SIVVLGRDPATGQYVNRARYSNVTDPPGSLVVRSAGAWFYFNAEFIRRHILSLIEGASSGIRVVVIDCSIVPAIDTTAGVTVRTLARALKAKGIGLALAELRDDVLDDLKIIGAEKDLGPLAAHRTIDECIQQAIGPTP